LPGMKINESTTRTETNDPGAAVGAVWVQCPGFRCLAYQDEQGRWRTFFSGEILSQVFSTDEIAA
jgi:hypothetical protein